MSCHVVDGLSKHEEETRVTVLDLPFPTDVSYKLSCIYTHCNIVV